MSRSKYLPIALCVACLLSFLPGRASAIVINAVEDPDYVTGNDRYTGVTKIVFNLDGVNGLFLCSGSLISDIHILTAGHCLSGAANWNVTFETPSGTTTIGTSAAALHPEFRAREDGFPSLAQYDVGILTLNQPAPVDAQRYGLKLDLTGFVLASLFEPGTPLNLVGYGLGGNPAVGFLDVGVRRHAQQTVVVADFVPDQVLVMGMSFGFAPDNYGLINAGDSGGPALFGDQVLGVASFSSLPRPGTGQYEVSFLPYLTGHESLADPITGAWVAGYVSTQPVPEPGTIVLLLAGVSTMRLARSLRSGR